MSGRWEPRARHAAAGTLSTDPERLVVVALSVSEKREVYACAAPAGRVVAKCYGDAETAAASSRALERVGGRHGAVLVPRCLHYDAARQVIVQDLLPGGPFFPLLEGADAPVAVRHAARALAALHRLPGRLEARRSRAAVIAESCDAVRDVPRQDRGRAAAAFRWAKDSLEERPEMPHVVCHGDFGWAQMLDCDGAVGVVDFDRAAESEPAFDVGNLVAQLVRRRASAGRSLADALIEEYEGETGWPVRDLVFPYAVLVLVRKLGRLQPHHRGPLRAALAVLDDERHGG
jgi:aminoglycoside phosphotransferase (APT) family kinase protein